MRAEIPLGCRLFFSTAALAVAVSLIAAGSLIPQCIELFWLISVDRVAQRLRAVAAKKPYEETYKKKNDEYVKANF